MAKRMVQLDAELRQSMAESAASRAEFAQSLKQLDAELRRSAAESAASRGQFAQSLKDHEDGVAKCIGQLDAELRRSMTDSAASRQEFAQSLKDHEEAVAKCMGRLDAELRRSMSDQAASLAKADQRAQDHENTVAKGMGQLDAELRRHMDQAHGSIHAKLAELKSSTATQLASLREDQAHGGLHSKLAELKSSTAMQLASLREDVARASGGRLSSEDTAISRPKGKRSGSAAETAAEATAAAVVKMHSDVSASGGDITTVIFSREFAADTSQAELTRAHEDALRTLDQALHHLAPVPAEESQRPSRGRSPVGDALPLRPQRSWEGSLSAPSCTSGQLPAPSALLTDGGQRSPAHSDLSLSLQHGFAAGPLPAKPLRPPEAPREAQDPPRSADGRGRSTSPQAPRLQPASGNERRELDCPLCEEAPPAWQFAGSLPPVQASDPREEGATRSLPERPSLSPQSSAQQLAKPVVQAAHALTGRDSSPSQRGAHRFFSSPMGSPLPQPSPQMLLHPAGSRSPLSGSLKSLHPVVRVHSPVKTIHSVRGPSHAQPTSATSVASQPVYAAAASARKATSTKDLRGQARFATLPQTSF